jgi:uncharacterized phiE125 gp8 family phage protein
MIAVWKVTVQPTAEPITLDEAKAHLRVELDQNVENDLIDSLITGARQWAENYMNRAIVTQTITAKFPAFKDEMFLPMPPVASVTAVSYLDPDNASQTLAASVYGVNNYVAPAVVYRKYNEDWPETYIDQLAVTVEYVAGDAVDSVPVDVKRGILLLVGHLFENREDSIVGTSVTELPMGATSLLLPHRVLGV